METIQNMINETTTEIIAWATSIVITAYETIKIAINKIVNRKQIRFNKLTKKMKKYSIELSKIQTEMDKKQPQKKYKAWR